MPFSRTGGAGNDRPIASMPQLGGLIWQAYRYDYSRTHKNRVRITGPCYMSASRSHWDPSALLAMVLKKLCTLWEMKMRTGKQHTFTAPGHLVVAIKESGCSSTLADAFLGGRQPAPTKTCGVIFSISNIQLGDTEPVHFPAQIIVDQSLVEETGSFTKRRDHYHHSLALQANCPNVIYLGVSLY